MRLLSDVARGQRLTLAASPGDLPALYRALSRLRLRVSVGEEGIKVPREVIATSKPEATLAVWIASLLSERGETRIGVDPGASNIGVAVLVDDMLVYTGRCSSEEEVAQLISDVAKITGIEKVVVKMGATGPAATLREKLGASNIRVVNVDERRARDKVIIGDFTMLKRLRKHELDAVKIALYPEEIRLRFGDEG